MLREVPVVINTDIFILNSSYEYLIISDDELKFTFYEKLKSKFRAEQFITDIKFLKENIRNDEQSIKLLFIMSDENYAKIKETLQKENKKWDRYVKSYTENTNGYISLCSKKDFANPVADNIFEITMQFLIDNYFYDTCE